MRITSRIGIIIVSLLLISSWLLASCDNGEPKETPTPTPTISIPNNGQEEGKSFIWEITSDISTVYVMGTVHIANPNIYPLESAIENAFEQSDYLVVEVNTNNVDSKYMEELTMQYGEYQSGDSLENHIPEDLYSQLNEEFGELGLDIRLFNNFKPWMIATTLETLRMMEYGYRIEHGIDFYLMEEAVDSNKVILDLETIEYQLELFSIIPDDLWILSLKDYIEDPNIEEELNQMFSYWENGNADGIETLIFQGIDEYPELAPFYEELIYERNFNMVDKIETFLNDNETYFIAVGAGHLVGDNGIISLLEEKDYTVNQL